MLVLRKLSDSRFYKYLQNKFKLFIDFFINTTFMTGFSLLACTEEQDLSFCISSTE